MSKPNLSLYIGQRVTAITRGDEPWQWGIKLESGVEIRNKSKREIFRPMKIVNARLTSMSLDEHGTTLHFTGRGATLTKVGLNPTKYVIADPKHGGEVYPQWPELLEEMGIPAIEGGEISDQPSDEWDEQEMRLKGEAEARRRKDRQEFLAAEEE